MQRRESINEFIELNELNEKSLERDFNESLTRPVEKSRKERRAKEIDRITDALIIRYVRFGYDAEKWRRAICKAVWRIPTEARIWELYESSFNPWVEDSLRYFLGACRKEYGQKE